MLTKREGQVMILPWSSEAYLFRQGLGRQILVLLLLFRLQPTGSNGH